MYKATVTYEDFDGNAHTENLYFNLTKTEIAKMQLDFPGGLEQMITNIQESGDNKRAMEFFDMLITKSYGERTGDGIAKRFIKSPEVVAAFKETAAYDEYLWTLISDGGNEAVKFFTGITESSVRQAEATAKKQNKPALSVVN
jgi:hypothetical protein